MRAETYPTGRPRPGHLPVLLWGLVLLVLLLTACGPPPLAPLPESVGTYQLAGREGVSPRVYRYRNHSGATITLTEHEYPSEVVALEAIQKWPVAPGAMPLHQGRRVLVASGAPPAELSAFLQSLRP